MARREIRRFSDEQIERANRVDVVDYVKSLGYEVKKQDKKWYKATGQGGLYFYRPENTWHWETQDAGGRGAISLCMKLEGKDWKDAVKTLLGEEMEEIRHAPGWQPEPEPPKEFKLPSRNDTYRHVFAYLIKTRGIDENIVKDMVDKNLIYENTQRSCVFVGRDKDGQARHASVRSTNTNGKVFKQDVAGSQKQFSFSLSGASGTLNVFEAPIDMLSYMTLQKEHGLKTDDSYLALGGVTDKALVRFLEEYPNIQKIRVCTDHDEAGEGAAVRIYEKYHEQFKITRHRPTHKDFNEDLVALKYPERTKAKDNETQKAELLKLGIDQNTADWYMNAEKNLVDGMLSIQGNSNLLYIYDTLEDLMADVNMEMRLWNKFQEDIEEEYREKYSGDEYRATYNGVTQMKEYLAANPQISHVFIKTSQMDEGVQSAEELKAVCGELGIKCDRIKPECMTFAEDLAMENAVTEVMGQTPMNDLQYLDMAAGMEM